MPEKGIDPIVKFIQEHLNAHPEWFPKWRKRYLSICSCYDRSGYVTGLQLQVLKLGYNQIFDKVHPLDR
jgi:hypothetical protein